MATHLRKSSTGTPRNHALFRALLVLLIWAPFPHGGERFWEIGPIAVVSFLLLAIWSLQQWKSRSALPRIIIDNQTPLLLLLLWLVFILLQTISLPMDWLSELRPEISTNQGLGQFDGLNLVSALSIDPGSTLLELIKYASYSTLFFLTLVLTDTRKRLKELALTLFLTGLALSLYSLFNHYTKGALSLNESIPPWINHWDKATRGTFSHTNHFAGFLEMTISLGIGLLLANFKPLLKHANSQQVILSLIDFFMSLRTLHLLAILVMIVTLYLTASRGGNGAFVGSFLLVSVLFFILKKKSSNRIWVFPSIVAVLLLASISSMGGGLPDRLTNHGFGPNGRDLMTTAVYEIATEFPIFGSGAGTYPYYQYRYKEPDLGTNPMSKRAHNDYLETLTDQGIIGTFLLGSSLLLFLFRILSGIRNRQDKFMQGLLFGSCIGVTSVLFHSLVEFNFRIPANAIYFWVLIAIGMLASSIDSERARHR